jgi:hypothetical protein
MGVKLKIASHNGLHTQLMKDLKLEISDWAIKFHEQ